MLPAALVCLWVATRGPGATSYMKANQRFRDNKLVADDTANVSTRAIIGTLVAIVLVTSLVGIVADNVAAGQASSNLTATQKTLLGLLTLAFILVPVIAIFRNVGGDS